MKTPKPEFLELTRKLNREARERILSRLRKKLLNRYLENPLGEDEVIALQLEREDDNLKSWQARLRELRTADSAPAPLAFPPLAAQ